MKYLNIGFGEFALQLIARICPIAIGTYIIVYKIPDTGAMKWYVALIFGIVLVSWCMLWLMGYQIRGIESLLTKHSNLSLRILKPDEIAQIVKYLYSHKNAKIYATHIGYPDLIQSVENDWAKGLYTGGCKTSFQRIVQVQSDKDRKWVKSMVSQSTNQYYSLKIVESVYSPASNTPPYPNYIVVDLGDGNLMLFLSMRSAATDGSGQFTFLTYSPIYAKGMIEHFEHFFMPLNLASEVIKQWRHI